MDKKQLISNIVYLLNKYLPDRTDLQKLIQIDTNSVKFIMSKIQDYKKQDYEREDLELIKEIAYYYI